MRPFLLAPVHPEPGADAEGLTVGVEVEIALGTDVAREVAARIEASRVEVPGRIRRVPGPRRRQRTALRIADQVRRNGLGLFLLAGEV